jgi:hypothetical protein
MSGFQQPALQLLKRLFRHGLEKDRFTSIDHIDLCPSFDPIFTPQFGWNDDLTFNSCICFHSFIPVYISYTLKQCKSSDYM